MALTPVDLIIKELCRKTGEPEFRNYDDFIGPVRRGFGQINIAAVQVVKHVYIPVNAYNALNWPCDCLKPIMVGLRRNKVIVSLSVDDALLPSGTFSTISNVSEAEAEINRIISGQYVPEYSFDIGGNGELYGLGPGFNRAGYVNHVKHERQSHIKGSYLDTDNFLFVYLSDGISDGLDFVPSETEPCIIQYGLMEYYEITKPAISDRARNKFKEEIIFLRNFYTAYTADDWAEAFNQNEKSSPK